MLSYTLRRLMLMVPTLFGILFLNFLIIQAAPGGPVDQVIAKFQGHISNPSLQVTGGASDSGKKTNVGEQNKSRGSRGLPPEFIEELNKQFGFDKPWYQRFFTMLWSYIRLDFGSSYFRDQTVIDLIKDKLPVSISLGIWTLLLTNLISIPLGIRKAIKDGTPFDVWSSTIVTLGHAIPSFLFAVLLLVVFAGGRFLNWFPFGGLLSPNFSELGFFSKIVDYLWHMVLPVTAMLVGSFATLTFLTKNSFLDEINKQYVVTARAKGLTENKILYGHVFRNAMLIVISGIPGALIGILFTSSLLIEIIFSLDGLGLLGFEAALNRDYPVIFGTLFIFALISLVLGIISDLTYTWIDPRIDFERRDN